MKVALVHDWLTGLRGGERCLQAFLAMYPQADIFTLLHVPGSTSATIDRAVQETSFLQTFPGVRRYYRVLLPLFPAAVKGFDLSGYDLIISLSHAAAKNIQVPSGSMHISYCFTPMRYIWDQAEQYFGLAAIPLWPVLQWLRRWDVRGAKGVNHFVAISQFVAARIRKFYGQRAHVIYPPVDSSWIAPIEKNAQGKYPMGEAFLYAGALVPYKHPEVVVAAFNDLGLPLWVVGSGPEERNLRRMAKANVQFFGRVSDQELASFYRRARALVFPGCEDFGLIPVECMAAGRPVIGLDAGGLRETLVAVKPWDEEFNSRLDSRALTGVFISSGQDNPVLALKQSLQYFLDREDRFHPEACLAQATGFGLKRFESEWTHFVSSYLDPRFLQHESSLLERENQEAEIVAHNA